MTTDIPAWDGPRIRLPRNAAGGYRATGLHALANQGPQGITLEEIARVYGASTQCAPTKCLHRLTKRQWKPKLAKPGEVAGAKPLEGLVVVSKIWRAKMRLTREWLRGHRLRTRGGKVVLYKRVNADFTSTKHTSYRPGSIVTADDWEPSSRCGGGLHFCARPAATLAYNSNPSGHFVACLVDVSEIVVIDSSKVKAPHCEVLYECTASGHRRRTA